MSLSKMQASAAPDFSALNFVEHNFRSESSLYRAIGPELPMLLLDPDIAAGLGPAALAQVRKWLSGGDLPSAIGDFVNLLRGPSRTNLRQALLQYVRDTAWMHDCLTTDPAATAEELCILRDSHGKVLARIPNAWLGDDFLDYCFVSTHALHRALRQACSTLMHQSKILALARPEVASRLQSPATQDQWSGVDELLGLLSDPLQTNLQALILAFVQRDQYTRFCLSKAVANQMPGSADPPKAETQTQAFDHDAFRAETFELQGLADDMWSGRVRGNHQQRAETGAKYKNLSKNWRLLGEKLRSRRALVKGFKAEGDAALERGDTKLAEASFARAAELLDGLDDLPQATLCRYLVKHATGDYAEAKRLFDAGNAMFTGDQPRWVHDV